MNSEMVMYNYSLNGCCEYAKFSLNSYSVFVLTNLCFDMQLHHRFVVHHPTLGNNEHLMFPNVGYSNAVCNYYAAHTVAVV